MGAWLRGNQHNAKVCLLPPRVDRPVWLPVRSQLCHGNHRFPAIFTTCTGKGCDDVCEGGGELRCYLVPGCTPRTRTANHPGQPPPPVPTRSVAAAAGRRCRCRHFHHPSRRRRRRHWLCWWFRPLQRVWCPLPWKRDSARCRRRCYRLHRWECCCLRSCREMRR